MTDDLIFDQDGYPTHAMLEAIRTWQPPYAPLFDRLGQLWYRGYFERAPRRMRWRSQLHRVYEVSTGGWSGHEDVINAMKENFMLWHMCWYSTRVGGHYIFRVPDA